MSTLYVGNLHRDTTEDTLHDAFSAFGLVESIRVCREIDTKKPLGYAYLNFRHRRDAARALKKLDSEVLLGQPMEVKWANGNTELSRNNDSPLSTSTDNRSVPASDDNSVTQAKSLSFTENKRRSGSVNPQSRRSDVSQTSKFTNVFVKNFGDELDDDDLHGLFKPYGTILSCKVEKDDEGKSRGFGFCNFKTSNQAESAVKALNGHVLNGRTLFVGPFMRQHVREAEQKQRRKQELQEKHKYHNLYIENLDQSIDDEQLHEEFAKFGSITSAKVMTDHQGQSRGYGFVCYDKEDAARKAIEKMNGSIFLTKAIYVGFAQRKEERQRMLGQNNTMQTASSHVLPRYYPTGRTMRSGSTSSFLPGAPMQYGQTPTVVSYLPMTNQRAMYPVVMVPVNPIPPQMLVRGGYAYPNTTRNLPNAIPVPVPLGRATPREQKQMLGERLYPLIHRMQPELAGKITGMILEMDNADILHMLESYEALKTHVEEAVDVLREHQSKQFSAAKQTAGKTAAAAEERPAATSGTHNARLPPSRREPTSIVLLPQEPLTRSALAKKTPERQKQMLGEHLFTLVQKIHPESAGKITAELLDLDNTELLHLIESPRSLKVKVEEIVDVLHGHRAAAKTSTD